MSNIKEILQCIQQFFWLADL